MKATVIETIPPKVVAIVWKCNILILYSVTLESVNIRTKQFWRDEFGVNPTIVVTHNEREDIMPRSLIPLTISISFFEEDATIIKLKASEKRGIYRKLKNALSDLES